jgi:multidrug efflux pump subunit AcrB
VLACRLRLHPILMTSFAFIVGVAPLALSVGAETEMRRAIGIAVFAGMQRVTLLGLVLTPVIYWSIRKLVGGKVTTGRHTAPPKIEAPDASSH